MNCRHCKQKLEHIFLDLGFAPHSNAYLSKDELSKPEAYLPLKLYVCHHCFLVQTEDYSSADELFQPDYAYFSSISSSWLQHAKDYVEMITERLALSNDSFVIEIASNDGYLLKNFITKGIPCLGIEPTDSTAEASEKKGIPNLREFFGTRLAAQLLSENRQADLIIGNNVYAHVPDINDFTQGMKQVLKPNGTITLEFPHLMELIKNNQFDTVYHEHYSYLSLYTVSHIFQQAGLKIFDVEQLSSHGGSLRIYGCHESDCRIQSQVVKKLIDLEKNYGLLILGTYLEFQSKADYVKNELLSFLLEQKKAGKLVMAYGAAAKGNTLLNYGGVKPDLLVSVFDAAPSKQGKFLPGSHIPILSPELIKEKKPDWLLILPWNIADEVRQQFDDIHSWGGRFITIVPKIRVS